MKVVSGALRGLHLNTPPDNNIRPTLDHVKQSFFNIIQNDIFDASFLDLFSGTAQIGIEALSRGANNCVFVDKYSQLTQQNIDKINKISKIDKTNKTDKNKQNFIYKIISKDVLQTLKLLENSNFDFIYADPPRDFKDMHRVFADISNYELVAQRGFVILEQQTKKTQTNFQGFTITKVRNYGNTQLVFFVRNRCEEYEESMRNHIRSKLERVF
ncbi:MAG: 16S rRNA (guanine(966)-N(2))-methyltransferase RsmD [Defluviitaleaceae bacterium]|nr:16S rRNA (guanine(966)-N(2))-methyltransferase RsmD [Defluviitaleaceae bacterium]